MESEGSASIRIGNRRPDRIRKHRHISTPSTLIAQGMSIFVFGCSLCLALSTHGCAISTLTTLEIPTRTFDFDRDVLTYTNNNYWIYDLDSDSPGPIIKKRLESIENGQRCTIMSRTVRQFWYGARFAPDQPKRRDDEYRVLIRKVVALDPRNEGLRGAPIVFPGYADLRSFSREHEDLLKKELGGRWIGYFQRGNWRMIFAFSPAQQRKTVRDLVDDLDRGHLPLVHILNFPRIDINHTVLLYGYDESPSEIIFELYDPNNADNPGSLVLDRASATFRYYRTDYFAGGPAKVYEIYDGIQY